MSKKDELMESLRRSIEKEKSYIATQETRLEELRADLEAMEASLRKMEDISDDDAATMDFVVRRTQ